MPKHEHRQHPPQRGYIGAVATIGLSFTGISPVLGGALAAYLDGGDTENGLRVGALSGGIASLPVAAFLAIALLFLPFTGTSGSRSAASSSWP